MNSKLIQYQDDEYILSAVRDITHHRLKEGELSLHQEDLERRLIARNVELQKQVRERA